MAVLSKLQSMFPKEQLQRNIFEVIVEIFKFFGILMKFIGQRRKVFLMGAKTEINFQGNKLWKNLAQKRKTYYFSRFRVQFFLSQLALKTAGIAKTVIYVALEEIERKHCGVFAKRFNCLQTLRQKSKTFSQETFFRVVTTVTIASRRKFWGKLFFK